MVANFDIGEFDIFSSTIDQDTTAPDEIEVEVEPESNLYGDAIDAEATFEKAAETLGVSQDQWFAFVDEVNSIKRDECI